MRLAQQDLTYKIRHCVFEVYRTLGCGFLEKVYENALLEEFELSGIRARAQVPIEIFYKGRPVGQYFADVLVDNSVLLELKAQQRLDRISEAQLLNYMKATGVGVGMLINFAFPKASIKRLVL
jgi:GxxExxY protein